MCSACSEVRMGTTPWSHQRLAGLGFVGDGRPSNIANCWECSEVLGEGLGDMGDLLVHVSSICFPIFLSSNGCALACAGRSWTFGRPVWMYLMSFDPLPMKQSDAANICILMLCFHHTYSESRAHTPSRSCCDWTRSLGYVWMLILSLIAVVQTSISFFLDFACVAWGRKSSGMIAYGSWT